MGAVDVFVWEINQEIRGYYAALDLPAADLNFFPLKKNLAFTVDCEADLVFIDCGPDAADGLELLREIKSIRADVPIIFMTSAGSEEVVISAYKYGARAYFRKPFDTAEITETAERILGFKRGDSDSAPSEPVGPVPLPLHAQLPERLHRAIDYMEKHLTAPLQLENIAEVACLSKFHFCRLFKKHLGSTPIRFMLDLRIRHAGDLLRDTGLSVTSVAARSGFTDLSGFHKQFKRVFRCTPSSYRKTVQTR